MKSKSVPSVRILALLLVLGLGATSAVAYEIPKCYGDKRVWGTLTPTFYPALISFPSGSSWQTALNSSFAAWNYDTPGTRFRFNYSYTSDDTWAEGDGTSSIGFTSDYDWGSSTLAVELTQYKTCIFLLGGGGIKESDVLFNTAKSFNTSLNPSPPGRFDSSYNFKLVAIHELGHSFGFTPHEDDILATMNSYYPNSGVIGNSNDVHPHADDIRGNRAGYGTCCTERDLAVTAYERIAAGKSDRISPPATSYRGHSTSYKFTIANRGTTNQSSVRVQFYLSTNRYISTSDTYLGAATYSLDDGVTATYSAYVTVPASLSPGNYYFGYIIDPLGSIAEIDEGNNAVGHAFTTNVPTESPPKACFSMSPMSGSAPLSVSFDASCSSDPVGSISSYHWDFGDGWTATGETASHTYYTSGSYTIRLTVTDDSGLTSESYQFLYVSGDCMERICPEEPL